MNDKYQKAKITIELEDGTSTTFVAILNIRKRPAAPFDFPRVGFGHDGRWRGVRIPEPPRWDFTGTTVGEAIITIP